MRLLTWIARHRRGRGIDREKVALNICWVFTLWGCFRNACAFHWYLLIEYYCLTNVRLRWYEPANENASLWIQQQRATTLRENTPKNNEMNSVNRDTETISHNCSVSQTPPIGGLCELSFFLRLKRQYQVSLAVSVHALFKWGQKKISNHILALGCCLPFNSFAIVLHAADWISCSRCYFAFVRFWYW